jgi:hypothetical protein
VTANGLAGAEDELFFSWEVADDPDNPPTSPPSQSDVPSTLYRINPHTAAAHRVGLTNTAAPIVGLGFVDDTLYGFTFGPAVGEPNKVLKISRGTGKAKVVTSQDPGLDPVFAAIPVQLEHRPRFASRSSTARSITRSKMHLRGAFAQVPQAAAPDRAGSCAWPREARTRRRDRFREKTAGVHCAAAIRSRTCC